MGRKKPLQRSERRSVFHHMIEFSVIPGMGQEVFKGVTVNLSNSGLCIISFTPLQKGQKLLIREGLRVSGPAQVLWDKRLDNDVYKAGLLFGPTFQ